MSSDKKLLDLNSLSDCTRTDTDSHLVSNVSVHELGGGTVPSHPKSTHTYFT